MCAARAAAGDLSLSAHSGVRGERAPGVPLRRLGAALLLSVGLHLSMLYGVTVVAPSVPAQTRVIQVRVAPTTRDESTATARPQRERSTTGPRPTAVPPPIDHQPAPTVPIAASADPAPVDLATALPKVEMPLLIDPTWYAAKQLDVYPQLVAPVRPHYPDAAARAKLAGAVTLILLIDENGLVRDAEVAQADPPGYFEDEALTRFRAARFTPALREGRSVRSRLLVRVRFGPDDAQAGEGQR